MSASKEALSVEQIPIQVADLLFKYLILQKLTAENHFHFRHLGNLEILELKKITIQNIITDISKLNYNGKSTPSFQWLLDQIVKRKISSRTILRIQANIKKLNRIITMLKLSYYKEFVAHESKSQSMNTCRCIHEAVPLILAISEGFFGKRERFLFDYDRDCIVNINEEIQKYSNHLLDITQED
ncbi:MAG: hypothetical protein JXR73_15215 [Candidatus Omnitrophica bacterium]|nr:hypothetical protein [Candidatus Omnitrophota bacterium]